MAPQHPKNAIIKIMAPMTISTVADIEILTSTTISELITSDRAKRTNTPQTKIANPPSCNKYFSLEFKYYN